MKLRKSIKSAPAAGDCGGDVALSKDFANVCKRSNEASEVRYQASEV